MSVNKGLELLFSDREVVKNFVIFALDFEDFEDLPSLDSIFQNEICPIFHIVVSQHYSVEFHSYVVAFLFVQSVDSSQGPFSDVNVVAESSPKCSLNLVIKGIAADTNLIEVRAIANEPRVGHP